ncbi:hypothetical protein PPTG_11959 [Phytophthora nicotianae INRA-310]|uniref:Uncharacterized protein n=1 Tax=Phytophthora nicotianae (strain INRA-310) TaxID=761204 RepID=W2Q5D4_PHYN3|nr:hypothetical protein PPTG_11959 [Phytophthora nicotianae INRA-310]ETN08091.1 hypothetical protein PPTG_11959 [Phytophthora nicotianae INRA-310]
MLGLAVGEYKRATDFFLDWLRRAGGDNHHAGKRVQAINDVVKEIASDPSTLTPELLEELHTALDACQYSIMLRECVAAVYPEEDERQVGHQHFLKSLRRWYSMLQGIEVGIPPELDDDEDHWGYQRFLNLLQNRHSTAREVKVKTHPKWVNMQLENSNCYEVLHGDVDYISDEEDFAAEKGTSKTADVKRERLFGKAFAVKKGASKTVKVNRKRVLKKTIANEPSVILGHGQHIPPGSDFRGIKTFSELTISLKLLLDTMVTTHYPVNCTANSSLQKWIGDLWAGHLGRLPRFHALIALVLMFLLLSERLVHVCYS